MSIDLTLVVQLVVFVLLVWFTMAFIWPPLRQAMDAREKKIADGLAAAERGQRDLAEAKTEAEKIIKAAREQARSITDQADARAGEIIETAKSEGEAERRRQIEGARSEIDVEINRARDELRGQVAAIAVAGAERILAREIDANAHRALLDQLASEL